MDVAQPDRSLAEQLRELTVAH
ncbi:MAG: hypothetical protein QOD06_2633, partial [Candidatus Binatota bacterium]|nr:hypothetical protein [Candidatus Binatota bacterium]